MNIQDSTNVVRLRTLQSPFPEVIDAKTLLESDMAVPPQIIGGVLHQGCKMVLGGTSKTNKSWCLLDLAMSVASGTEWLGKPCQRSKALYINFELPDWALYQRITAIEAARPDCVDLEEMRRPVLGQTRFVYQVLRGLGSGLTWYYR